MTTRIQATVERGSAWWVATFMVDGVEYGTQACRLDQIVDMVRDAASLMTGRPETDFAVEYDLADLRYAELVTEYKDHARRAAEAEAEAASSSRRIAAALREDNLPMRDIASLMGISTQRVSQLAHV